MGENSTTLGDQVGSPRVVPILRVLLIRVLPLRIPLSLLARGTGLPRDFVMLRPSSANMTS